MFVFACLIGIYAYIIFLLGILGWLNKGVVLGLTILFWGGVTLFSHKVIRSSSHQVVKNFQFLTFDLKSLVGLLFIVQALVNLIGALGPELGFDALWYHLTLPKLYLENHSVFFIPGGLLYYSAMPKLAEMLYIAGFSFGNEVTVKIIHFIFGLLTCFVLYKLTRKFFTPFISFVAIVIFYSNLVIGWESITGYVDLARGFFEVMALLAFINWLETKKRKWFIYSAIMVGLAITTKVLAIGSLVLFSILIIYTFLDSHFFGNNKEKIKNLFIGLFVYWLIALALPLPWFIFSFIHTGNPVYPFFSGIYPVSPSEINIFSFFRDSWELLTQAADPVSPIYLMFLPLIVWILWRTKENKKMGAMRIIGTYSLLAIVVWYFTPRSGGGRFIVPYLPAFSILCAAVLNEVLNDKKKYGSYLGKLLLGLIIVLSLFSIGYRFVANYKYIPVILGQETKATFLSSHLNFAYGDFYDTDGYFKKHIKQTDRVLLFGFHNLYYVDFPFVDATWLKPGDEFNYIATQNTSLPKQYSNWILVYENEQTMVKLYKMPERLYSLR